MKGRLSALRGFIKYGISPHLKELKSTVFGKTRWIVNITTGIISWFSCGDIEMNSKTMSPFKYFWTQRVIFLCFFTYLAISTDNKNKIFNANGVISYYVIWQRKRWFWFGGSWQKTFCHLYKSMCTVLEAALLSRP